MDEWRVFLLIGEVVALFLLVGKPLLNLNTTIATLKASVDALRQDLGAQKKTFESFAKESAAEYKALRESLEGHSRTLVDHDFRITALEKKE